MPGFVGIVSQAPLEPEEGELDRMVQRTLRRDDFRVNRYQNGTAGLAGIQIDDEKTVSTAPGLAVTAIGSVVQQDVLKHRLMLQRRNARQVHSLSDLILELYAAFGIEGLFELNGSFSAAIWEETTEQLILIRDPLGLVNLYYWRSPDRLMFATEIKAISWHPQFDKKLDNVAIADVFIYETMQHDRTLFACIRSVPPAGYMTYQTGIVHIKQYWEPHYFSCGIPLQRRDDYIDGLGHHIREAVRRRVRPKTCLLITGGLDSRILAETYKQVAPEMPLQTATIGTPTGRDVIIGQEIARVLGYPHDRIPIDGSYYARYAATSAWRAEGKVTAFASWIYALEPYLREKDLRFAMTGLFGNMISGRHYPPALLTATSVDQAVEIIRRKAWPDVLTLKSLMRPGVFRRIIDDSFSWQEEVFRCAEGSDLLNRFDQLALRSVVTHTGQNLDIFGDAVRSYDPFTDKDLMEYALSLPARMSAGGFLYKKMIAQHLPRVAGIRHGRTGHTVKHDVIIDQYPWLERIDYLQRQALKRLWPGRYSIPALACIPQAEALRNGSHPFILDVLARAEYLEDYFDMAAVGNLVQDHVSGKVNAYKPLGALITISLWRQQFCGEQIDLPWDHDSKTEIIWQN